ncbi:MAG TPA: phage minor capsid protein [Aquella sp.]|nr:phage minor capsid protein [Aquella sp.]
MLRSSMTKENDNVYLNVIFEHPQASFIGSPVTPSVGTAAVPATYSVNKTIPIIDKCSDYYCSVIRFDIPLNVIPLLIMPIIPNQVNPNLTPMIIGISYNGTDYPVNLIYVPTSLLLPPVQNQLTQVVTPYYYTYCYQTLIDMINIALTTAYTNAGLLAALPGIQPPFFFFDPATQLISLVVHTSFTSLFAPLVAIPKIFVNEALQNFLYAYEFIFQGNDQPNGKDYIFTLNGPTIPSDNQGYALFGTAPTHPPTYFKFTEEYPIMQYWTSLRKIIIGTNTIPVVNEIIPVQNPNGTQTGVTSTFPIITDFVPSIEFAGQSRAIAYYYPSSQYRLVDMNSETPLYKIDLTIYWQDRTGNLYPVFISLFQQASIKIAFLRKSLYKPFNTLLYK